MSNDRTDEAAEHPDRAGWHLETFHQVFGEATDGSAGGFRSVRVWMRRLETTPRRKDDTTRNYPDF